MYTYLQSRTHNILMMGIENLRLYAQHTEKSSAIGSKRIVCVQPASYFSQLNKTLRIMSDCFC